MVSVVWWLMPVLMVASAVGGWAGCWWWMRGDWRDGYEAGCDDETASFASQEISSGLDARTPDSGPEEPPDAEMQAKFWAPFKAADGPGEPLERLPDAGQRAAAYATLSDDSDIQPDPYVDGIAAGYAQEYESENVPRSGPTVSAAEGATRVNAPGPEHSSWSSPEEERRVLACVEDTGQWLARVEGEGVSWLARGLAGLDWRAQWEETAA